MKLLTEVVFSIFFSLFLSFCLTSYIDIISSVLQIAREKSQEYCQENLTKLFSILITIGTVFATCNYHAKNHGIPFAMPICRKSLPHKHLRRFWRARLVVSPLVARVYIKFCVFCISVQYPPKRGGKVQGIAVHTYSLPIAQSLV